MNDKLFIWAQGDREFAQVLLFVKVCAFAFRICLHWDNMTSRIHARNVLCLTGCTSQHCKYNTESQSRSRRMQSDFIPFLSAFLTAEEIFLSNLFHSHSFFSFQSNDAGSFQLAAGKKHLSRSISFPKAFPDRDRWCPFKRSHGSVLFLVLTTHTDTETHWETHNHADVDTQQSLHLCVHTDNHKHEQHMQMHM